MSQQPQMSNWQPVHVPIDDESALKKAILGKGGQDGVILITNLNKTTCIVIIAKC